MPRGAVLATFATMMNDATDLRLDFPATARNGTVILDVLRRILPDHGWVVEIGSGSGQHAVHFQQALPGVTWQATDPDPRHRASIAAWIAHSGLPMPAPIDIDASAGADADGGWSMPADAAPVTAVVSINMIHITPWACCMGLLANAARLLSPGGVLYLYGPFKVGDRHTAPSNEAFDRQLRAENEQWGVRNLDDVALEARRVGFQLAESKAMPANNLSVIFRRVG